MATCFNCNAELDLSGENVSRKETCPHCYADLHSCKMCSFYDSSAYNECKEPMADRIVEKEKSNFCDYFKLGGNSGKSDSKEDLLSQANALFKK
jgi:hypothetical protein